MRKADLHLFLSCVAIGMAALLPQAGPAANGPPDESVHTLWPKEFKSIHQAQQEEYGRSPFNGAGEYDGLRTAQCLSGSRQTAASGPLTKRVVGWHPHWMGTAYTRYDYSLLSAIAHFSYEVNPSDGGYLTLRSWDTTPLVAWAHSNNVKALLTATCFGNSGNKRLLTNAAACQNLIDTLVSVVSNRGGDGVNVDFEDIGDSALRPHLTAFLRNLAERFHRDLPGSEVSVALPAVDWSGAFDVAAYEGFLDYCILMGYSYHYPGSPHAGPVAPLKASATWGAYCVENSVSNYLGKGLSAGKLLLGCPYCGYDWPTADYRVPSATRGIGDAALYYSAAVNAATYGRQWNPDASAPFFFYTDSGARQCWYDDSESLSLKYDLVLSKGLGGIGIWALGYDGDRPELWQLLAQKFASESDRRWAGAVDAGGGWKYLAWFGFFYPMDDRWIYHSEHHWLCCFGDSPDSIAWWDDALKAWSWTSQASYPNLYWFMTGFWVWYQPGTVCPHRLWYRYDSGKWITEGQ